MEVGRLKPSPSLGPRFERALSLALRVHRDDTRKGKRIPYITHLLGVCDLVLQDGGSEDEAIAALLHDTLEDHPESVSPAAIKRRFGKRVLDIVRSCTDTPSDYRGGVKPPWRVRKLGYLDHLSRATRPALRVALADKLYNARDLLSDARRLGHSSWKRFNAGPQDQLWYLRGVIDRVRAAGFESDLVDQLALTVSELKKVCRPIKARQVRRSADRIRGRALVPALANRSSSRQR